MTLMNKLIQILKEGSYDFSHGWSHSYNSYFMRYMV